MHYKPTTLELHILHPPRNHKNMLPFLLSPYPRLLHPFTWITKRPFNTPLSFTASSPCVSPSCAYMDHKRLPHPLLDCLPAPCASFIPLITDAYPTTLLPLLPNPCLLHPLTWITNAPRRSSSR